GGERHGHGGKGERNLHGGLLEGESGAIEGAILGKDSASRNPAGSRNGGRHSVPLQSHAWTPGAAGLASASGSPACGAPTGSTSVVGRYAVRSMSRQAPASGPAPVTMSVRGGTRSSSSAPSRDPNEAACRRIAGKKSSTVSRAASA